VHESAQQAAGAEKWTHRDHSIDPVMPPESATKPGPSTARLRYGRITRERPSTTCSGSCAGERNASLRSQLRPHRVTGVVPAESKWQCSRVIWSCLLCCRRRKEWKRRAGRVTVEESFILRTQEASSIGPILRPVWIFLSGNPS
jgi:hypothetical protein